MAGETESAKGETEGVKKATLVSSPRPLPQPANGETPMNLSRLAAYRDKASEKTTREAAELLTRTGPLVLDGVHYALTATGEIVRTSTSDLGLARLRKVAVEAAEAAEAAQSSRVRISD